MSHTYASRRLPGFAPIARGQLWFFVSTLLRAWPITLIAIAFVAFTVQSGGEEPDARLFISGLLALFLALAAWPQQKTAGGLAYFRSLPPSHSKNAAMRAGVFWVVLIGISLVSFILIASGPDLGGRLTSVLVRESGYDGAIPFPVSGPALVGATFTFLILSAAFSSTRFPGLWLQPFVWGLLLWGPIEDWAVNSALRSLLNGRYGVMTVFTGRFRPILPDGSVSYAVIEPKTWLVASALWIAAGLSIFIFAITRHREY